jgi:hypothetical protein
MNRLSIILGIAGAFPACVADGLLLGQPVLGAFAFFLLLAIYDDRRIGLTGGHGFFRPTHFPRWYVVFAPYLWVYLGSYFLPLVPAPLGGYLFVSGVNLAMLVFFAATGALLWNLKQG